MSFGWKRGKEVRCYGSTCLGQVEGNRDRTSNRYCWIFQTSSEDFDLVDSFATEKALMTDIELKQIKEKIRNFKWDPNINWKAERKMNISRTDIIPLNPSTYCSEKNPLYMHKIWLERVYFDSELNLKLMQIAEICGLEGHNGAAVISNWKKRFGIPKKVLEYRIGTQGEKLIAPPFGYSHPQFKEKLYYRGEHIIIMEDYLRETLTPRRIELHPCLIKGVGSDSRYYIKRGCPIHHINYKNRDNRPENLWIYESNKKHSDVVKSLNKCFKALIKLGQIYFNNGIYYLDRRFDSRDFSFSKITELLRPISVKSVLEQNPNLTYSKAGNRFLIKLAPNYDNPFAHIKKGGYRYMFYHRYLMEQYLRENRHLTISKNYLVNGKYLDPQCIVHHINLDPLDNRIENFWVSAYRSTLTAHTAHRQVHATLLKLVDDLLNLGFIHFQDGFYYLHKQLKIN